MVSAESPWRLNISFIICFNFLFIVQLDCCSSGNGCGELDNGSSSPFSLFCTFCYLSSISSGLHFCLFIFVFVDI